MNRCVKQTASSAVGSLILAAGQTAWAQPAGFEWVHGDWPVSEFSEELTGERVLMELPFLPAPRATGGENRVDLVFVGDGFTAGEIPYYQAAAHAMAASVFGREPLLSYAGHFRVSIVDVVSNESGVDHDPFGTFKDTALDMGFHCNSIPRLLCVDVNKAYAAAWAGGPPDVDQVVCVANSGTYGGAGYVTSNVATVPAGIPQAVEVLRHELGHSLGDLADEYFTPGTTYPWPEPVERNVSTYDPLTMGTNGQKWAPWLGHNNPLFDDLQYGFQGGQYYDIGVFRPSDNSLMRSLWRPFNCPSAEAIIIEIYKEVSPIDAVIPASPTALPSDQLFVVPLMPMEPVFQTRWEINGMPMPWADNTGVLDLNTAPLQPGLNTVTVTVWDDTPMVRDQAARQQWMTDSYTWTVDNSPCNPADIDIPFGVLDLNDINAFIGGFLNQQPHADLAPPFGVFDLNDINLFVGSFVAGCP